jgi:hypothetical protein
MTTSPKSLPRAARSVDTRRGRPDLVPGTQRAGAAPPLSQSAAPALHAAPPSNQDAIPVSSESGSKRPSLAYVAKACGHDRHVGTCSACQRAQLARWQAQLADATRAGSAKAA